MMTLGLLARLVDKAVKEEPPRRLKALCGEFYAPYYFLLYLVSYRLAHGLRVELGVEKGRGCGAMLLGNPRARTLGLDHTRRAEVAGLEARFLNFTYLELPSLPPPDGLEPIVLLHIDTEHSYAMAQAEFEAYQPYLTFGAVVCFDDLHAQNDGVLQYFYSLPYPKLHDDRLHPTCGFGALVYV